eukprot:366114-Chlamydomonas_euryale.AAC.1
MEACNSLPDLMPDTAACAYCRCCLQPTPDEHSGMRACTFKTVHTCISVACACTFSACLHAPMQA